jgi:hypothetical protein
MLLWLDEDDVGKTDAMVRIHIFVVDLVAI